MLKNDYLVVKIGVDTAENGPFQVEESKCRPMRAPRSGGPRPGAAAANYLGL